MWIIPTEKVTLRGGYTSDRKVLDGPKRGVVILDYPLGEDYPSERGSYRVIPLMDYPLGEGGLRGFYTLEEGSLRVDYPLQRGVFPLSGS